MKPEMEAVYSAECNKHKENDEKCKKNDWVCVPMAVDFYGVWGAEARKVFVEVGTRLAMQLDMPRPAGVQAVYNLLSVVLVRNQARAILARAPTAGFGKGEILDLAGAASDEQFEASCAQVADEHVDRNEASSVSAEQSVDLLVLVDSPISPRDGAGALNNDSDIDQLLSLHISPRDGVDANNSEFSVSSRSSAFLAVSSASDSVSSFSAPPAAAAFPPSRFALLLSLSDLPPEFQS